jgi:carboxymethylenebutenolidase
MDEYLNVSVADGQFSVYIARPTVLPAPAVVVIQELFGVNADLRTTCHELAAEGYFALCPDLFWRQERCVDLSDRTEAAWQKGLTLYRAFNFETGVADTGATMDAARKLPGSTGRVGVMGFCLGGLMTFLTLARKGADAAVAYYGGGTEKHLDEAGHIEDPLLMHLGEEDEYIPVQARRAIVSALAGNRYARVFTYPGCRHAFARHQGAHYDPEAASLANRRTLDFLATYLRS